MDKSFKRETEFKVWDKYSRYFNHDYAVNGSLVYGVCEGEIITENEHLVFLMYTGMKDKNDNKIFEGDILRYWYSPDKYDDKVLEVKWFATGFALYSTKMWSKGHIVEGYQARSYMRKCEIIGNIFKNPELITE